MSPKYQAIKSSANSASEIAMRTVSARASFLESSSPLPRER